MLQWHSCDVLTACSVGLKLGDTHRSTHDPIQHTDTSFFTGDTRPKRPMFVNFKSDTRICSSHGDTLQLASATHAFDPTHGSSSCGDTLQPIRHTDRLLLMRRHTPIRIGDTRRVLQSIRQTDPSQRHTPIFLLCCRRHTPLVLERHMLFSSSSSAHSRSLDKPFGNRRSNRHFFLVGTTNVPLQLTTSLATNALRRTISSECWTTLKRDLLI